MWFTFVEDPHFLPVLIILKNILSVKSVKAVLGRQLSEPGKTLVEKTKQRLLAEQRRKQLEKAVRMDYQLLESGKGQELLANMKRGRFQHAILDRQLSEPGKTLPVVPFPVFDRKQLRQHYEFLELEEPERGKEELPASDVVEISFEHVYCLSRYPL